MCLYTHTHICIYIFTIRFTRLFWKSIMLVGKNILFFQYLTIFAVVSLYWTISISTVFLNKTLLNSGLINLNAPFFVTWTQCVISTLICFALMVIKHLSPKVASPCIDKSLFFPNNFKKLLLLSILFVATIVFNNLCLSLVGVSFYFISRSLTTVFNVIFTYLILKQLISLKCLLSCVMIVSGFFLGIKEENILGTLSVRGVLFGVFSSFFLSLYSIYIKKLLPVVDNQIVLLSFYNNFYSSFILIPLIYINDEFEALKSFYYFDASFWLLTFVGGVFGFMIGFVSALQIQVTSPLTHNISGTAKSCTQTVIATFWYNEDKSFLWWVSNCMVLAGSAAYARIKQLEMAMKQKIPLPS